MAGNQDLGNLQILGLIPPDNHGIGLNAQGLFNPWYYCCFCNVSKEPSGNRLPRCSRCGISHYCHKICQILDWEDHKKICGKKLNEISADLSSVRVVYSASLEE